MGLSDVELAMLNSVMYDSGVFDAGSNLVGRSFASILEEYIAAGGLSRCSDAQADVIRHALDDQRVRNLVLVDKDSYLQRGSSAVCWEDPTDGGLYVVFQGTGTGDGSSSIDGKGTDSEWYTDAMGLAQADTEPQVAASNYVEYIARKKGRNVVVTGHSNGANKAMYCAIVSPFVIAAVAFDGQGFSQAFFDKYADEIASRSGKITFFGQEGDYVGPLLKALPIDKRYVAHGLLNADGDTVVNLGYNHSIDSMFVEVNGKYVFVECKPSSFAVEIQRFMDYLYDTYPPQVLECMAPLLGKLLDSFLGTGELSIDELLADPSLADAWRHFLGALVLYEGLDDLAEAFCEAFEDSMSAETAASLGLTSPEALVALIHAMLERYDPLGTVLDGLRKVKRVADQIEWNARTGGAVGNRQAVRDFSDAKRRELLAIVREVESEPWYDPSRWDVWYRAERWFGLLTIQNYQNDMNTYYRKTIDVDGVTAGQINRIFDQAQSASQAFSSFTVPQMFSDRVGRLASEVSACI